MAISAREGVAVEWTLLTFSLLFVILRLYVRWYIQRHVALSDLFVVLAWLMSCLSAIADLLLWEYGLWDERLIFTKNGKPDFSIIFSNDDTEREIMALKVFYWSSIPFYVSLYCVKASFVMFYLVVFPVTLVKLRRALYFTIAMVIFGFLSMLFIGTLWCNPVKANWDPDPARQCLTSTSAGPYITTMVFHLVSDLLIYILPFFLLRSLHLSRSKKVGLVVLLSLGSICIGSSVARIALVGYSSTLITFGAISAGELASGIIVACLPPLKWLYHSQKRKSRVRSPAARSMEGESDDIRRGNGHNRVRGQTVHMPMRRTNERKRLLISALDRIEFHIDSDVIGGVEDGDAEYKSGKDSAIVDDVAGDRLLKPKSTVLRVSGSGSIGFDVEQQLKAAAERV